MKWSSMCGGMVVGLVLVMQAAAQDAATSLSSSTAKGYRAPLAGAGRYSVAPRLAGATAAPALPEMPVSRTGLQRATDTVVEVGGKAAVVWAAQKHGTTASVPPPAYAPYRPNAPMPEPGPEPVNCQPNGSVTTPVMCPAR